MVLNWSTYKVTGVGEFKPFISLLEKWGMKYRKTYVILLNKIGWQGIQFVKLLTLAWLFSFSLEFLSLIGLMLTNTKGVLKSLKNRL